MGLVWSFFYMPHFSKDILAPSGILTISIRYSRILWPEDIKENDQFRAFMV